MKINLRHYLLILAAIVCGLVISSIADAAPPTSASNLPSPNATVRGGTTVAPAKATSWIPWSKGGSATNAAAATAKTNANNVAASELETEIIRGRNFEKVGDWEKARKVYTELRAKYANHPAPAHRLGIVADQQKKYGEAERLFTTAIQLDPRNADYMNDLGYCYYLQGRFKEAEQAIRQAIQLKPNVVRFHNNLAMAMGQQGRHSEALQHLAVAGSEADAYFNLGFIFASQEKPNEAKECFRKALAIDPTHQKARDALSSFTKYESLPPHMKDADEFVDDRGRKWIPYSEGQTPTEAADGQVRQASAETAVNARDMRQLNQEVQQKMRAASLNRK